MKSLEGETRADRNRRTISQRRSKKHKKYKNESTIQFYAKKGMAVHGVMVQKWTLVLDDAGNPYPVLEKFYIAAVTTPNKINSWC